MQDTYKFEFQVRCCYGNGNEVSALSVCVCLAEQSHSLSHNTIIPKAKGEQMSTKVKDSYLADEYPYTACCQTMSNATLVSVGKH